MQITLSHLVRNTNTNWSYIPRYSSSISPSNIEVEEIDLEVPAYLTGDQKYKLIDSAAQLFRARRNITFASLHRPIDLPQIDQGAQIPGQWRIVAANINTTIKQKILQYFPFTRMIDPPKLVHMKIVKTEESCITRCVNKIFRRVQEALHVTQGSSQLISRFAKPFLFSEPVSFYLLRPAFSDPFTELAATSAQTTEFYFEMEAESRSSFRFVKKGTELYLEEMSTHTVAHNFHVPTIPTVPTPSAELSSQSPVTLETAPETSSPRNDVSFQLVGVDEAQREENSAVVSLFIQHLTQEYGFWLIDFLKFTYNVDLQDMLQKGLPLTPDHVLKANVGANNIETGHLFALLSNLKRLASRLDHTEILDTPFIDFLRLDKCGIKNFLSLRELRNLLHIVRQESHPIEAVTCKNVLAYLANTFHVDPSDPATSADPTTMNKESFNKLIGLIAIKNEDLDRVFTGRKIRHLPIFGYNTMGNKSIPNRCRDLFELLHIFPELKNGSWPAYYELLSHVVAKKTLYRPNIDDDGSHVGLLIPGPTGADGQETWYYNDTFIDDSSGNFSYTLKPACDKYKIPSTDPHTPEKPLPFIKLYRSTASDASNPNGADSVAADFNYKGPGSLKPELSYHYEKDTFAKRTIPLWMGYVLLGRLYKDSPSHFPSYKQWMYFAVDLFSKYRKFNKLEAQIPKAEVSSLHKMLFQERYSDILSYLIEQARYLHELPQEKIGQDIAFVGHSLGGALAQAGLFEFCTNTKRIPLPGCDVFCVTSHTPGTENKKNAKFMKTGDKHEEMLRLNHIRFHITHQLEKGDFVPESGESHLGSKVYQKPTCLCISPTNNAPERSHNWLDFSTYVFSPLPTAQTKEIVAAPTHGRKTGHSIRGRDFAVTTLSQKDLHDFDHAWFLFRGKLAQVFEYKILGCPKATESLRRIAGVVVRGIHKIMHRSAGPDEEDRDDDEVLYLRFSSNRALRQLTTRQ